MTDDRAYVYLLARSELSESLRLKGGYALAVSLILLVTTAVGLYSGIFGAFG